MKRILFGILFLLAVNFIWFVAFTSADVFYLHSTDMAFPAQLKAVSRGSVLLDSVTIAGVPMKIQGIALPLGIPECLAECAKFAEKTEIHIDGNTGYAIGEKSDNYLAWIAYKETQTTFLFKATIKKDQLFLADISKTSFLVKTPKGNYENTLFNSMNEFAKSSQNNNAQILELPDKKVIAFLNKSLK